MLIIYFLFQKLCVRHKRLVLLLGLFCFLNYFDHAADGFRSGSKHLVVLLSGLRDLGLTTANHGLSVVTFDAVGIPASAILLSLLVLLNSSCGDHDVAICIARLVTLNKVLLLRVSAEHLSLGHMVLLYVVGSLLGIH